MSKPTIFFSHSSRDQKELKRLKELFVHKTGGTIDAFLSSDGQSIPLGRNWVHTIQEALENAALMIVFITPSSLRSNWIFFESGYAYSKRIQVVPVGFLGVDLATLPPPMSLLQGFNITSEEGLTNLIALSNQVFNHSHDAKFTVEEYREICLSSGALASKVFGEYGALIDNIYVVFSQRDKTLDVDPLIAMDRINEMLETSSIEHTFTQETITLHGVTIAAVGMHSPTIQLSIDPGIAEVAFPIVEKAISEVRSGVIDGISIRIDFLRAVGCLTDRHKVTGRIYGSDIKLAEKDHLIYQDIEFHISHLLHLSVHDGQSRTGATYLSMTLHCDEIPLQQMGELVQFLFDREILFVGSETLG